MTLLGEDLTAPKLIAIALAVYAVCYGTLFLIFIGIALLDSVAGLAFFGLIALATTPFFAIAHLNRVTDKGNGPPARPAIMATVMAVPAAFWLYASVNSGTPLYYTQFVDAMWVAGFILIPGLLSLWLAVTFAVLAVQGRTKDAADIE